MGVHTEIDAATECRVTQIDCEETEVLLYYAMCLAANVMADDCVEAHLEIKGQHVAEFMLEADDFEKVCKQYLEDRGYTIQKEG